MRDTKVITLEKSGAKVTVKAGMTWGEKEDLKDALMKGTKIGKTGFEGYDVSAAAEQKYLALETLITEVEESDGAKHKFTREWVRDLSIADGDQLIKEINEITQPIDDELKKEAAAAAA